MMKSLHLSAAAARTAFSLIFQASAAQAVVVALMLGLLTSISASADDQVQKSEAENSQPIAENAVHVDWISDVKVAQEIAKREGKDIILFFTGSDWCAFCIQMEEEILTKPETAKRLGERYVPIVLDFPHESELSLALTIQNEALKKQFGINGFPTIFFVDADLLPYSQMAGYRSPADFWKTFDQISALGAEVSAIKAGDSVADIQDAARLDRLFESVPRDMLELGWLGQVQRMVDHGAEEDQQIRQSWGKKLAQIQHESAKRKFVSEMSVTVRLRMKEKAAPDVMLADLDWFALQAEGKADLLDVVKTFKAHYLFEIKRFDEASAIADEVIAAGTSDPKTLATMKALKQRIANSEAPEAKEGADVPLPILIQGR